VELRADDPVVLRVRLGPRDDRFGNAAIEALGSATYEVTTASNRVGLRLAGPELAVIDDAELPSEGMVAGALQVPPSGLPVLLLADHPVTGGYPVIAVVVDSDLDAAGQVSPGERLRFRVQRSAKRA
jgi:allophanate hydrolase subunit 2